MEKITLPRHAKGPRPDFFAKEPGADQVLGIALALASELAVTRERLDTLEQLLAAHGITSPTAVEAYEPTMEDRERRELWRQEFLARLFRSLEK
jgi:hypothetical protein